jgi:hypothetical protein
LKKEILSDDFKKRKIFWKIFHLTSLPLRHPLLGTAGHVSMDVAPSSLEASRYGSLRLCKVLQHVKRGARPELMSVATRLKTAASGFGVWNFLD